MLNYTALFAFVILRACQNEPQRSPTALPPVLTPPVSATPTERKLVWADEFDKPGVATPGLPDTTRWRYDVGGHGFGNNELQFYRANRLENARIENGRLIIEARKERHENREYTSAKLITRGKHEWKYGRFEIRAKLPPGRGSWPAIWMLGSNIDKVGWPLCGEIDIMEHVGFDPNVVHGTLHTDAYNHVKGTHKGAKTTVPTAMTDFNVYAVEWTTSQIDFFVNDQKYHTLTRQALGSSPAQWPLDQPYYLILNVAVGGNWGGQKGVDDSTLPYKMEIDYVRVYQ